jgi:hypothetical protein
MVGINLEHQAQGSAKGGGVNTTLDWQAPAREPNEPGIFPVRPEDMPSEQLARLVVDRFNRFKEFLPYIAELRKRFAELPRGHANIMGCQTWTQFCKDVLGRTDSAVRKALAVKSSVVQAPERTLLAAIERMLPVCGKYENDGVLVRFSVSENGNLVLRGGSRSAGSVEDELAVQIIDPPLQVTFTSGAEKLKLDAKAIREPVDFPLNVLGLVPFLKRCEGDPTIVFRGPTTILQFSPSEDGLLRIVNCSARAPKAVLQPTPHAEETHAEEKYTGEFLPDLKVGDEVAIIDHDNDEAFWVMAVEVVTCLSIRISNSMFDREGRNRQFEIWRIATDKDRQRAVAWEEMRHEKIRAKQAQQEVEQRQLDASRQRVRELISCLPGNIHVSVGDVYSTGINLVWEGISFEQLEKIVEALQPVEAI